MKYLKIEADPTKQMVVDYINASNEVNRYAVSVMAAQLPALASPPDNYDDYAETLTKAKMDASVWIDEIIPDFNLIPHAFIGFNSLLQDQLDAVQSELNQLKADPGSPTIIQNIKDAIGRLVPETSGIQKVLSGLDSSISVYQSGIKPDADSLNQLTTKITAAVQADQTALAKMHATFDDLQSLIDARNKLAKLDKFSEFDMGIFLVGVSIAVGIIFTGVPGLIIGGIVGVSCTVYTTFDPVHDDPDLEQSIEDIQKEMNYVNKEIGVIDSTVGLLQQLSSTLATLVTNSEGAGAQIKVILDFWKRQEDDLTALVSDIGNILSGIDDPAKIDQLISEIQDAQTAWNDVDDFMQLIKDVTYTITQINSPQPSD